MAIALVDRLPYRFRSIADQVIRSASSVPANLSEGHGRFGKDRFYHYSVAYASANEVDTFIRILLEADAIDKGQASKALELFDQVRAMTWRLIHRKR